MWRKASRCLIHMTYHGLFIFYCCQVENGHCQFCPRSSRLPSVVKCTFCFTYMELSDLEISSNASDIFQVDDTEALVNYPYRDDAILIHKAIHNYVKEIVNFYYRK